MGVPPRGKWLQKLSSSRDTLQRFFKGDLPFITINSIEIALITIDAGLINLFVTVLDIASYADALLPILPNK